MPSVKAQILLLSDAEVSATLTETAAAGESYFISVGRIPIETSLSELALAADSWLQATAGGPVLASLTDTAGATDSWGATRAVGVIEQTIADIAKAVEMWFTAMSMRIDMGTPTIIPGTFLAEGAELLPRVKSNLRSPSNQPTEWSAEDANMLRQALIDLRSYIINSWPGESAQTVTGSCAGNPALASLVVALERVGVILNRTDNLGLMETVGATDALYCSRA